MPHTMYWHTVMLFWSDDRKIYEKKWLCILKKDIKSERFGQIFEMWLQRLKIIILNKFSGHNKHEKMLNTQFVGDVHSKKNQNSIISQWKFTFILPFLSIIVLSSFAINVNCVAFSHLLIDDYVISRAGEIFICFSRHLICW